MNLLYEKSYDEPTNGVQVRLSEVDEQYQVQIRFYGKGTMTGARAFLTMLDEMVALSPTGARADTVLDTRELDSAPLRSQLILTKWMIQNRHFVDRIAMLGAKPMVRRLASAVLRAARFDSLRFARTPEEAAAWTGFCPE